MKNLILFLFFIAFAMASYGQFTIADEGDAISITSTKEAIQFSKSGLVFQAITPTLYFMSNDKSYTFRWTTIDIPSCPTIDSLYTIVAGWISTSTGGVGVSDSVWVTITADTGKINYIGLEWILPDTITEAIYIPEVIECDTTLSEDLCEGHSYFIDEYKEGVGYYYYLSKDLTEPCSDYFEGIFNDIRRWEYPYQVFWDNDGSPKYVQAYMNKGDTIAISDVYPDLVDIASWWTQDSATFWVLEVSWDTDSVIISPQTDCWGMTWNTPADTAFAEEYTLSVILCDTILYPNFCLDWLNDGFNEIYVTISDSTYHFTSDNFSIYGELFMDEGDYGCISDSVFRFRINIGQEEIPQDLIDTEFEVSNFYIPDGCVACDTTPAHTIPAVITPAYQIPVQMPSIATTIISSINDTSELCPALLYTEGFDTAMYYQGEEELEYSFVICNYGWENFCSEWDYSGEDNPMFFSEIYLYGEDTVHIAGAVNPEEEEANIMIAVYVGEWDGDPFCTEGDSICYIDIVQYGEPAFVIDSIDLENYTGFYIPIKEQIVGEIIINATTLELVTDTTVVNSVLRIGRSAVMTPQTEPSNPTEGMFYYNAEYHMMYFWDGSEWREMSYQPN